MVEVLTVPVAAVVLLSFFFFVYRVPLNMRMCILILPLKVATITILIILPLLCIVFSCHWLTGLLMPKGEHGIFNMCKGSRCMPYAMASLANVDWEELKHCPSPHHVQESNLGPWNCSLACYIAKRPQTPVPRLFFFFNHCWSRIG